MSAPQDTFEASRTEKLHAIEALGLDPWGGRFDGHQAIADVLKLPADVPEDQRPRVRIAGRIVSRREGGKVHFLDLKDWSGKPTLREIKGEREGEVEKVPDLSSRIQVMIGQKQVGETGWQLAQQLDLGDLLGVDGTFGKTRRGEPTIFAEKLTFLGKSLLPHPDKWGGMQDMEFRLRHRYLDLIYNPETLDRARKRMQIVRTIRRYLDDHGYLRGRDADAARHRRRGRGPAVHHAPQRPGHRPVSAHRPGTAPEAAAGRRHREGLRDRPGLPQRGHQPASTIPNSP